VAVRLVDKVDQHHTCNLSLLRSSGVRRSNSSSQYTREIEIIGIPPENASYRADKI
jgi:hypothetical protein